MDEAVLRAQKWLNETYTGKTGYSPITEDGITVLGGYINMKIKDTEGLEYYVFSYDSRPEGGTLSHVQTIFIAIDGSKYKMRYVPDDFSDGDVVSDYDEEGNL